MKSKAKSARDRRVTLLVSTRKGLWQMQSDRRAGAGV